MRILNKAASTVLALSFFVAGNFCLVECAFASEQHGRSAQVRGSVHCHSQSDSTQEHHNSEKHDGTICCSSLVTIDDSSSYPTDIRFDKDSFSQAIILERFALQLRTQSIPKVEYRPGVSPPTVFLLTHFNHAPPVSF